jgi:hypothetical protein
MYIYIYYLFVWLCVCLLIYSFKNPPRCDLQNTVWDCLGSPTNISQKHFNVSLESSMQIWPSNVLDESLGWHPLSTKDYMITPKKNPRHFTIFTWMLHSSQGLGRLGSPRPRPAEWCHPCKRACKFRWVPKPQTATQHPRHRIHGHEKYVEPLHWRLNLNADLIWVWLILYDV